MGDSIAAAVRANPEASAWLILPADLPLLQSETIRRVAAAPAQQAVVRPVYQGRHGHPVRFARACGPQLMGLEGNQGAALVVKVHDAIELIVDDAGCVTDIDTVQDLQQAQALWQRRQP